MEKQLYRVCLFGPSGTGKSTMGKWLAKELNVKFLDGSRTSIIDGDKGKSHIEMLNEASSPIEKNLQILSKRHKMFLAEPEGFVCDRSIIDPLAYLLFEGSKSLRECDIDHLFSLVNSCHSDLNITHYIYMPFSTSSIVNCPLEDNGKRIVNPYFQRLITKCFDEVLDKFLCDTYSFPIFENKWYGSYEEVIRQKVLIVDKIPILFLRKCDNGYRKGVLKGWLKNLNF